MKVVLVTGGFDPLHSGHIKYFQEAKKLGDILCVGVNSDEWLTRKKGRPFMSIEERLEIINNIKGVGMSFAFDDSKDHAVNAINHIRENFPKGTQIIFANGGDRRKGTTPEVEYSRSLADQGSIIFAFGVGGNNKKNSSSWILDEWKTQKTERGWGYWRVLDDKGTVKAKELVINPGQSLSDQRHFHRSEHWYILEGAMNMDIEATHTHRDEFLDIEATTDVSKCFTLSLNQHDTYVIHKRDWHKAYNPYEKPCHILEVQYGNKCIEEDIERRTIINKGMR